jgi:chromosome segregation ATPase
VTTLQQHIDDLDPQAWGALTKQVAARAVAAAEEVKKRPAPELVALAAMTESDLIEHHRNNAGTAKRRRPTARARLIEADHQRALAEQNAREAHQDKQDAIADAAAARAEAQQSATAASVAREKARAADAESARKDAERAEQRREGQAALDRLNAQLAQVRAEAAAEVEAASQEARAAQQRAEQRMAERTVERAAGQQAIEQLHAQLAQVRADAAAEVEAASQEARAAQQRAQQRMAERTEERAAGQQAIEQLHAQLAQVRADAAAQIDAARDQAAHAMATAQQAMEDQITQVRADAHHRVDVAVQARIRAEADAANLRGQAEADRAAAAQVLTIPIPPWQMRPETRRIETLLTALHQINYILEVGMAEEVVAQIPLDAQLVHHLVRTVQGQTKTLPHELSTLPANFSTPSQVQAAAAYALAAEDTCRAFLIRISIAAQQLRHRNNSPDAEIISAVMNLFADPDIQELARHAPG